MAIKTWNGGGGNNNWTEAANWGGTAPVAGDDLVFAGSTRLTPNNNFAADTSFNEITFDTGAGSFTLTGNRITVTGDIETKAVNPQTIALNMIFNATRTFCPSFAAGQITVSGIISGAGGIDKNNINEVALTGLNTYTGITKVVQGTLSGNTIKNVSGGASSFGAPTTVANGTIELSGFGGSLKYTGSGDTTDRVLYYSGGAGSTTCSVEQAGTGNLKFTSALTYVNGAKTIEFKGSTAGTGEISGVIADTAVGAITITKTGTGTWTFSGANTYTGVTTISAGTLSGAGNLSAFGTGDIKPNGGTLQILNNGAGSGGTITFSNTIVLNTGYTGAIHVANNGSNTNNTVVFPTATWGANNTLNVTGANGYALKFNALWLDGGADASLLNPTSANLFLGTVSSHNSSYARALQLGGTSVGNIVSDVISDYDAGNSNSVEKVGSGTWTLSAANTYAGATTISAGKLIVTGSLSASSAVTVASAATLAGTGTVAGTVSVSAGGIIEPGVSSEATLNTGALTLNNISILTYGLGTVSDKIAVTGALVLDGTINVTAVSGFKPITYLILTYTGALTNNTMTVGTMPSGYYATVSASGGNVYLLVSAGEQHSTFRGVRRGVGRGVG